MNYGLYLSASGVLTNMYRQDVFSNNLANVATVGFKVDKPAIRQRDPEAIENNLSLDVRKDMLERLGGGVFAHPAATSFTAAQLTRTDQPLDVALDTDNTFFAVEQIDAQGTVSTALTRNGAFMLDSAGYLVTASGGHRVLDDSNQPIEIGDQARDVVFDSTGRIHVDGQIIGNIQVARVDDTASLEKIGHNLLKWNGDDPREILEGPAVRSGYLEASGVDPIKALMDVIAATRAVSSNAEMIRYQDGLMEQAVNTLGRVA